LTHRNNLNKSDIYGYSHGIGMLSKLRIEMKFKSNV